MCVLSPLSFSLTVAQQPAVLFPVLSTLHKQEADLSLSLKLFPFICPFLSVPWSLFLPFPTLPPPGRGHVFIMGSIADCFVTRFIQDKCDSAVSREVRLAASHLYSPCSIPGIPVFPPWASPGKLSEMLSYGYSCQ